jgi:predicted AlkP superfamily phosphohydrolase/phosphomutase
MTRDSKTRTAMISLDSVEVDLVRSGIAEGWLPNFAAHLRNGRGVLLQTDPTFIGASRATLITAAGPIAHQLFFDKQLVPGSYSIVHVEPDRSPLPPVWRYVSDDGLTSTIVSVYSAPVLDSFRGTQVIGWGNMDPYSVKFNKPQFHPPEIGARLEREVPGRRSGFLKKLPTTEKELDRYIESTLRGISQQAAALSFLMRETSWNLFWGSIAEPHEAGHLLWHLEDPSSESARIARGHRHMGFIRRMYRTVDAALGAIVRQAPSDVDVFFVTPDGMHPNSHRVALAPSVLEKAGWLVRGGSHVRSRGDLVILKASGVARALVPKVVQRGIAELIPGIRERIEVTAQLADVDWGATAAFVLPNDGTSFIRFNLIGREPHGIVEPGAGYEKLSEAMTNVFMSLRDADSDEPLVERVVRADSILGGEVYGSFPDLIVFWTDPVTKKVTSNLIGSFVQDIEDVRSGDHTPRGFMIGSGPSIAAGGSQELDGHIHATEQVGPTVLRRLGLAVPAHLEADPISSLL